MAGARAIAQGGRAVWLTGLPSSGKSTLGAALVDALRRRGEPAIGIDSDALRPFLFAPGGEPKGYDPEARDRLYGLITHLARLVTDAGVTVVISATAHRRAWRDAARAVLPRFMEVYLEAGPEVCASRDPKGLWAAARAGEIRALPGVGVEYEAPVSPEVRIAPDLTPEASLDRVMRALVAGR